MDYGLDCEGGGGEEGGSGGEAIDGDNRFLKILTSSERALFGLIECENLVRD